MREAQRAFNAKAVAICDGRDRKHQRPGREQPNIAKIASDRRDQLNKEGEEYKHPKPALSKLAACPYRIGDAEITLDYQRNREE